MIKLVEVGPRDGLQNEKKTVSTEVKLKLIENLISCGLKTIEVTSFVSPKAIPQLADHKELFLKLPKQFDVQFPVLIPNRKGLEEAIRCDVKQIAIFTSASETFSQKNTKRSIAESMNEYAIVIKQAKALGLSVRGYISCALGCPYEGAIKVPIVVKMAKQLHKYGCHEIALADTIGVGTPNAAKNLVKAVSSEIGLLAVAVHFHDTYGQALANILSCLEEGITTVDSAVAGLGGCPYARGATGNVATEEVVYMLEGMGIKTGVDLEKLISAGEYICHYLQKANQSKVATAMIAKRC